MAFTTTDEGSGLDSNFDTGALVTKGELYAILAQLKETQKFYELEIFEVVSVDDINVGEVTGRYVISEQGDTIEEVEDRIFLPLNSNIIQFPLRGELWLGMEYKGNHYYLSRLSEDIKNVNFSAFNESTKIENKTFDFERGVSGSIDGEFIDINPPYMNVKVGDTLLQGRFSNFIRLGSDKNYDGTITIDNDTSFISMTTEEVPTTLLNSDRIEITANTDELDLLAKKDIIIDSDEGDVLIEAADRIRLRPRNSIIDLDIKNGGTLLTRTKDGFPFGQLDMIGFLKQVTGIQKIFQALIIGIPKLSSPATLPSGVKDIVKGLKGAQQFVDATINLEFLSQYIMETKTIEEIKSVLPIPAGFGGIIGDIANITDEQIKKLEELEKSVGEQIQKASELQSTLSQSPPDVGSVKNLIDDGSFDSFDGVADLRSVLGDNPSDKDLERYISNGGLSSFENQVSDLNSVVGSADTARSYKNLFKAARS